MCFACDGQLIIVDHRIPIGCNTFLWATTASSHDVTTINFSIKIFSLACKWSIDCAINIVVAGRIDQLAEPNCNEHKKAGLLHKFINCGL